MCLSVFYAVVQAEPEPASKPAFDDLVFSTTQPAPVGQQTRMLDFLRDQGNFCASQDPISAY